MKTLANKVKLGQQFVYNSVVFIRILDNDNRKYIKEHNGSKFIMAINTVKHNNAIIYIPYNGDCYI